MWWAAAGLRSPSRLYSSLQPGVTRWLVSGVTLARVRMTDWAVQQSVGEMHHRGKCQAAM